MFLSCCSIVMGALVGFVSEDTQNFLFLLTYTQKNATAFGKKVSK